MTQASTEQSQSFRRLHAGPDILILANAWDAGSARLIESLGAKAIATSSAAVAWSLGYPDGNALPVPLVAATIASITRAVRLPVSADIEAGYAPTAAGAGEAAAHVIDAGAVGINIEDGSEAPELLCAKIAEVNAPRRSGADLFVNARIDVYLRNLAQGEAALEETIARAHRYREAGCDGIRAGRRRRRDDRKLVAAIDRPLNVLNWPGLPTAAELRALGVRRLSAGAEIGRHALNAARASAIAFLADGRSLPAPDGALSSRDINGLFSAK
jgi:2-methylisocitrate lyase-like PEP mutase family enzyme